MFMFGPGVYLQRTLISNNFAAFAPKSFTTWKDLSVVAEIEIVKDVINFSSRNQFNVITFQKSKRQRLA